MPPDSSQKEMPQSLDEFVIEIGWDNPKVEQGNPSKTCSAADLLLSVSPTSSKEINDPSSSPLIQLRYMSPSDNNLLSVSDRRAGMRNRIKTRKIMLNVNHVMATEVVKSIDWFHSNDAISGGTVETKSSEPLKLPIVFDELKNDVMVDSVAAVCTSSENDNGGFIRNEIVATVNELSRETVTAVIAELNSSFPEGEYWTDEEFFSSEAVLAATQIDSTSLGILQSEKLLGKHKIELQSCEDQYSKVSQCTKRKNSITNTPELTVKKSSRYTFALSDENLSNTLQQTVIPNGVAAVKDIEAKLMTSESCDDDFPEEDLMAILDAIEYSQTASNAD